MSKHTMPEVVIDHIPAETRRHIGSPSLAALLANGTYVASHDIFGEGSTYDTTRLFISRDRCDSWSHITTIKGQFWSGLFVHRDVLYLMGTTRQYGYVSIRKSEDGGVTWSVPETLSPWSAHLIYGLGRLNRLSCSISTSKSMDSST